MIGKIILGKSFRKCLNYCLGNKPGQEEKESRAQILEFNYVGGNKKEIISQFEDLGNNNPRLANKVMHITLSFPPDEILSPEKLKEIAGDCGLNLGFEKNQSIVIQHNDTKHQHIHIVVNRVGFDGKTLSDSNNYKKMSDFCRTMERKFNLTQVQSPRKFQPKLLRDLPRLDVRKGKLKSDISRTLFRCRSYETFEQRMTALGYEVIKGRGIAFKDREKVYTKGSQVGYSLSKIEDQLNSNVKTQSVLLKKNLKKTPSIDQNRIGIKTQKTFQNLLNADFDNEPNMLLPKKRKKKKRGLSI